MNYIVEEKNDTLIVSNLCTSSGINKAYLCIKRIFDIVLSIIGMVLLSPLFLILGIIIKLDSKGPVFFVYKRVGKYGKSFKLYKFRTMHKDSHKIFKNFSSKQKKNLKKILN